MPQNNCYIVGANREHCTRFARNACKFDTQHLSHQNICD